jgi:hypothetical protein
LATVASISIVYAQGELTLVMERMSVDGDYVLQTVAIENHTNRTYKSVSVECGFYNGRNELVGSGIYTLWNIEPGNTGHTNVGSSHAGDTTHARAASRP